MPLYEYECQDCGNKEEYNIACMPSSYKECKKCGGRAYRIFSPPIIVQKGYETSDARYSRGKG